MRPEVGLQISVDHQLHHDECGLALGDDAEQLHDVVRIERSVNERIGLEFVACDITFQGQNGAYFMTDASFKNSMRSLSVATSFTVLTAHRTSG